MTTIGGKSLADDVRIGMAGLKKQIDALKLDAAAALTEFTTELKNGNEGVKRIREETAAVKSAFAEILGNEQAT
jgi:ubiquinone biosynthesis protein UbiJ